MSNAVHDLGEGIRIQQESRHLFSYSALYVLISVVCSGGISTINLKLNGRIALDYLYIAKWNDGRLREYRRLQTTLLMTKLVA